MSYKITTIPPFDRQAKRLNKKFTSFKTDLLKTLSHLKENPIAGTSLGNSCFKMRVVISSKQKGKSGGARLITHFIINSSTGGIR